MKYFSVEEARAMPGIRLVLGKGMPGIWGQAVKKILEFKGLDFVSVAQYAGEANAELVAWTGHRNAPVLVCESEPALARWQDIIVFLDKLKPEPALQPKGSEDRVRVFGILNELAGEWGYGWCGRLMIFHGVKSTTQELPATTASLLPQYGYTDETAAAAPERCADILKMLAGHLHAQREAESDFFVGTEPTAADIYWACFSNLLEPWPAWACDLPPELLPTRRPKHPAILAAKDPILIEHRDMMFRKYLSPITF